MKDRKFCSLAVVGLLAALSLFLPLTALTSEDEVASIKSPSLMVAAEVNNELGMVTGSPTGTYYRFGHDIKNIVGEYGLNIIVKESKGSVDNINRVGSKENAAFGIVQSDVLGFLKRSSEQKSQNLAENLRMVFPFYNEEVHLIANKSITSFESLEGKTIVVGQRGSGSWLTSINLLNITGVRPLKMLRLSPEEGLVAVLNGKADAMIFVAGKPVKLFKNLDSLKEHENYSAMLDNVHFVPITNKKVFTEYSQSVITKNDYSFVTDDIPTAAVTAILVSYDFSDAENQYSKVRCDNIRQFSAIVSENIDKLKGEGHPKWQEVSLDAGVGIWKRDKCAVSSSSSAELEDELLNAMRPR